MACPPNGSGSCICRTTGYLIKSYYGIGVAQADRDGEYLVSAEWVIDKHGIHKSGGYRITREAPGVYHLHYRGELIETAQSINRLKRTVAVRTNLDFAW